ncbi:MAG: acetyl-CoA carboxylase biotin carboxyl carrier protein [Pseudomonadota bacterium]
MTQKPQDSDVAFIRALAELLRENDLTELQVKRDYGESDSLNVRVSRAAPPVQQPILPVANPAPAPAAAPTAVVDPGPAVAKPAPAPNPSDDPNAVTSPMVGTIYLQAEPGTPAFVSVGDQVSEGQTLLIVEAMKTMNQIPSPRAGVVKRILVDDGAPVEYGEPLMVIE